MVVIKSYSLQCILCTVLIGALFRETKEDNLLNLDTAVLRSKPGLHSPSKAWWAKEVTQDFHIAGRLTERQMKYASEAGFQSILSLFIYDTDEQVSFGGEYLPTTAEAWAIAHSAGQQYIALVKHSDDWGSVETVQKFGKVIETLQRPILLHCDRGYTITFVTLMYMANQTRYNSSFEPKIYSENFYRITAAMGLDFTHDDLKQVVANITGESVVLDPPKPYCNPSEWLDFWLAHPVFGNWYTAGQIRKCDVKVLEETGFKSVVNMRLGVTRNNEPSQEEVTLLNVKDGISSYGKGAILPRQHPQTLESNRLNKHVPLEYIRQSSHVNYEKINPDEFGDDIGYNETLEKEFFKHSTLKYYHAPISTEYSSEKFSEIKDTLLEAGRQGPVLVHCRSARRVAYYSVLAAAVVEGLSLEWALRRIQELGFQVNQHTMPDVYHMYTDILEADKKTCKDEL